MKRQRLRPGRLPAGLKTSPRLVVRRIPLAAEPATTRTEVIDRPTGLSIPVVYTGTNQPGLNRGFRV